MPVRTKKSRRESALKSWDTRRANEQRLKRSVAAKKAWKARRTNG